MNLYINGDSYTYGSELPDPATQAWPMLLAKKLNADLVCDAQNGGSNYRTLYQTMKSTCDDYDFTIVAWSTPSRFTFYNAENNHGIDFNPKLSNTMYSKESYYKEWGETLYKHWYNELYAFKIWLQQIIQLQTVLKAKDRPYLMLTTYQNNLDKWLAPRDKFIESIKDLVNFEIMDDQQLYAEHEEIQYYLSQIDTTKFYQWSSFFIIDLCKQFPCAPRGLHFLEEGHQHMADSLFQHLTLNNCV
jgi:hypothetical protein